MMKQRMPHVVDYKGVFAVRYHRWHEIQWHIYCSDTLQFLLIVDGLAEFHCHWPRQKAKIVDLKNICLPSHLSTFTNCVCLIDSSILICLPQRYFLKTYITTKPVFSRGFKTFASVN